MHALSSGLRCNGGPMSKNNLTEAGATEPANKERKAARRTVQLKSSAWYQAAVRSIGITKESNLGTFHSVDPGRHRWTLRGFALPKAV